MQTASVEITDTSISELRIEEYANIESLEGLRDQWNDLARRVNLSPAEEFEWLKTLWEFHRANRVLLVLVARDDAGITGIAPLVKGIERRKGMRVQVLRMLGSFHSLHGTPFLLDRRPDETLNAFVNHLTKYHGDWALWFTGCVRGSPQEAMLFASFARRGYQIVTENAESSPYLELQGTFEEKVQMLQPRFRTSLRSRERRLKEKGKLELRFLDSVELWEKGLDAIREIEEDSWKVDAGTAITAQDFQWQFYRRYTPIAASAGTLRIPILYLDDEPLAYDYALLHRGVYYLMKTSYKNKWHDSYPGFVLRYRLMAWTYLQHAAEIDFLGKNEDWKMKWTETVRPHVIHVVFNRNFSGSYLRACHRATSWVRK